MDGGPNITVQWSAGRRVDVGASGLPDKPLIIVSRGIRREVDQQAQSVGMLDY
jgi:hypothetical protein